MATIKEYPGSQVDQEWEDGQPGMRSDSMSSGGYACFEVAVPYAQRVPSSCTPCCVVVYMKTPL